VKDLGLRLDHAARERELETLRAGRALRDVEARLRTRDGSEVVAIAAPDVVVIDGRACVLTALTEITDRVRAEERCGGASRVHPCADCGSSSSTTTVTRRNW
jgi:PAS domain-containing protein